MAFSPAPEKRDAADELADHRSKAKFLYVADKRRGEDLPLLARVFDSPSLSIRNGDSVESLETLADQPSTKGGSNGFPFGWHLRNPKARGSTRRKPVAHRITFDLSQGQASDRFASICHNSFTQDKICWLAGDLRAQYVPNVAKRPYFAWTALFYL
jgi:hypothetical protein